MLNSPHKSPYEEGSKAAIAKPEEHFVVIDGFRGVAAIIVLYYHLILYVNPILPHWLMATLTNHGYLAVDAFFVISGYVIAHAFDQRVATGMTLGHFMLHRVVRLYPMILIGTLCGVIPLAGLWLQHRDVPLWHFGEAVLSGGLLIPTLALADLKPYVFPLNSAYWSLSFEMVMYLAYHLTFKYMRGLAMVLVILVSAGALIWVAIHEGNLNVGFTTLNYWDAFARVIYSFAVGMLIRRMNLRLPLPRLFAYVSVPVLTLVLLNPIPTSPIYDTMAVLFLMPALIVVATQAASDPHLDPPLKHLGEISYPLYAIHFPLILILSRITQLLVSNLLLQLAVALTFSVVLITLALLLNRFYDLPVRRYLTRVLSLKKRPQISG